MNRKATRDDYGAALLAAPGVAWVMTQTPADGFWSETFWILVATAVFLAVNMAMDPVNRLLIKTGGRAVPLVPAAALGWATWTLLLPVGGIPLLVVGSAAASSLFSVFDIRPGRPPRSRHAPASAATAPDAATREPRGPSSHDPSPETIEVLRFASIHAAAIGLATMTPELILRGLATSGGARVETLVRGAGIAPGAAIDRSEPLATSLHFTEPCAEIFEVAEHYRVVDADDVLRPEHILLACLESSATAAAFADDTRDRIRTALLQRPAGE